VQTAKLLVLTHATQSLSHAHGGCNPLQIRFLISLIGIGDFDCSTRFPGVGPMSVRSSFDQNTIDVHFSFSENNWCHSLTGNWCQISFSLRQVIGVIASGKLEKGGRGSNSETFHATLRVNESRPAELGQQPEASLAWGRASVTAKRHGLAVATAPVRSPGSERIDC
jgi:hypothetical protein